MNDPIANATPISLLGPSPKEGAPKVTARSDDREIFREELSVAAQLANSSTQIDRSPISGDNSADHRNDHKPADRERVDKPERSRNENRNDDAQSQNAIESANGRDEKKSTKQAESPDLNTEEGTKAAEDKVASTSDNLDEASSNEEATGLKEALLLALEGSGASEEKIQELKQLLEQESAEEILANSDVQNLLADDPAAAVGLAFESLEAGITNTGLTTGTSEELATEETIRLASGDSNVEEVAPTEGQGEGSFESADDAIEPVLETTAESDGNDTNKNAVTASVQNRTQDGSANKKDTKSTGNGSIDLAALAEASNESEAQDIIVSRVETAATETPALATQSTGESDAALPSTDTTSGNERGIPGQTSNTVLDRAEATSTSTKSEPGPQVDPARFVTRVSKAFETAQSRGGGPIEIRLSPPELGSLQVRLEVKEGVLTASLETENQAARNALLDNLPALRERLAEQQIRIEKFDVDVRDDSNRSDQQQQQADAQNNREGNPERQSNSPRPTIPITSDENVPSEEPSNSTINFPEDGINVVA